MVRVNFRVAVGVRARVKVSVRVERFEGKKVVFSPFKMYVAIHCTRRKLCSSVSSATAVLYSSSMLFIFSERSWIDLSLGILTVDLGQAVREILAGK